MHKIKRSQSLKSCSILTVFCQIGQISDDIKVGNGHLTRIHPEPVTEV